ncbi:MAG TPA: phosphatase PAP2 family protein [Microbacteriaceae bacterium]
MSSEILTRSGQRTRFRGMLAPFRRFWATLIVSVLVALVVVAVAKVLAGSASWAHTEIGVDQWLSRAHVPFWDAVTLAVQWVLSPAMGLVIVVLVSLGVFWRTRDRMVGLTFLLVVAGGWLSSELVKMIVHRPRPDFHLLAHPLSTEVTLDSFPSGHTCLAMALALGFVFLYRQRRGQKWAIIIGAVCVLFVAWSRLYIGVHYPTDVIGSILYTGAAMTAFLAIWNQWLVGPVERVIGGPRARKHA